MIAFNALARIAPGATLQTLSVRAFRDLQRALAFLAYSPGRIDGAFGPTTRSAWALFKDSLGEADHDLVTPTALAAVGQQARAFDSVLSTPAIRPDQVKASIISACKVLGLGLNAQIAYVLATAEWETSHTFRPVKEAYWLSEAWRKANLPYYPYYGRGYVQLTWANNYKFYGDVLGLDLLGAPDLALDHYGGLFVIVQGFKTGAFAQHRLTDYVNAARTDFVGARRCINGQDKATEIAALAQAYLETLNAS